VNSKMIKGGLLFISMVLLAGCLSTPHAYKGEKMREDELSLLWGAGVGGTLSVTGVNGRDINPFFGGSLTAYVKPGDNKVRFFFTSTDYSMEIKTNVDWEVSFNCEKSHTYVFFPRITGDDQYLLIGRDMGTEYAFDENKPLGIVQIEAEQNGKPVEFY